MNQPTKALDQAQVTRYRENWYNLYPNARITGIEHWKRRLAEMEANPYPAMGTGNSPEEAQGKKEALELLITHFWINQEKKTNTKKGRRTK